MGAARRIGVRRAAVVGGLAVGVVVPLASPGAELAGAQGPLTRRPGGPTPTPLKVVDRLPGEVSAGPPLRPDERPLPTAVPGRRGANDIPPETWRLQPGETEAQFRARQERTLRQHGLVPGCEHTRGTKVRLGPREVQLPPDVCVAGVVVGAHAAAADAQGASHADGEESDFLILQRGASKLFVGRRTGRPGHEVTAPGEERAFETLKEALRR